MEKIQVQDRIEIILEKWTKYKYRIRLERDCDLRK